MLPDWILLILLFVGISIVPIYTPAMTPLEYAAGGLENLVQSVSAFIGLILLAVVLLIVGISFLVGVEHVRTRFGGSSTSAAQSTGAETKDSDSESDVDGGATSKAAMRPYKVAKARQPGYDDKLWGLLLILAGLSLLYFIPSYLLQSRRSPTSFPSSGSYRDSFPDTAPASTRDRKVSSPAGQAVLGALALVVLLFSFALMGGGQPKKGDKMTKPGHSSLRAKGKALGRRVGREKRSDEVEMSAYNTQQIKKTL